MGFAVESGYTPTTIETMMLSVMNNINTQFGTDYDAETFAGTNHYKYFYSLIQYAQLNDVKASEIFIKLQQYFAITNERISRPVVTSPGIIELLKNTVTEIAPNGYIASVKKPIEADAGKLFICVDVDDGVHATGTVTISTYANLFSGTDDSITVGATVFTAQTGAATPGDATFQAATSNAATADSLALQINSHATASLVVKATSNAGVVTLTAVHGGLDGNSIVLTYTDNDSNVGATVSGSHLAGGLEFDGDFEYTDVRLELCTIIKNSVAAGIPTQGTEVEAITLSNGQNFDFKYYLPNRIPTLLKLTTTLSENNQSVISSPDDVKALLLLQITARYQLGKNFEPEKYFEVSDAPWTSQVLLEWSIDDGSSYHSTVYDAAFDDLFDIKLENTELVEA